MQVPKNSIDEVGKGTPSADTPGMHAVAPGLDPAAIRSQLEQILVSVPFRNSKRYPALLRYVVEKYLNGTSAELKERTIGIDVFGRDPLYDPGVDPVVRISAGEVRKRLAQYYQQKTTFHELRIELPVGSYQPEFVAATAELLAPPTLSVAAQPAFQVPSPKIEPRKVVTILSGLAAALILVAAVLYQTARQPALDKFWRPVLKQNNSVMLCIGQNNMGPQTADVSQTKDPNQHLVAWWDAATLARVADLLGSKGVSVQLFNEDEATFADFQQRPAVLIGAFNDRWTLEWMTHMRFTFERQGRLHWIADRDHPNLRDWKVDLSQKDAQGNLLISEDYAIISRVANPRTGFITVTAAGLWGYGTLAAGRFLTDPKYFAELAKQAHLPLDKGDLQIVIGTEVIEGKAGPPKVLASAAW